MAQPGTGAQLMQILSRLGEGVRDVANPNLEQEQLFRRFLLQNPERARGLQRAQQAGEGQRAVEAQEEFGGGMVGAVGQAGQMAGGEQTNVGQAFGLSPEETESALTLTGIPSPTQQVEELTAERLIELGIDEERANAIMARTGAQEEEGLFNQEQFEEFREQGVPRAEAAARTAVANLETDKAGLQEAVTEMVRDNWRDLSPQDRRRFGWAIANPGFLEDVQFRQKLAADQLISRLKLRTQGLDRMKDLVGLKVKINKQLGSMEETLRSEDIPEDQKHLMADRWNSLRQLGRNLFPEDPRYTADVEAGFVPWSEGVKFKPPEEITRAEKIGAISQRVIAGEISLDELQSSEQFQGLDEGTQTEILEHIETSQLSVPERVNRWQERTFGEGAPVSGSFGVRGQRIGEGQSLGGMVNSLFGEAIEESRRANEERREAFEGGGGNR